MCLWFLDPNGTDVATRLPIDPDPNNRLGQEIDPDHIVTRHYGLADDEYRSRGRLLGE